MTKHLLNHYIRLSFMIFSMITTNAVAGGCDWATETPADDGKYKYFVARVYSEYSISDAQIKAEQEINNQICRLFGAETITSAEYYSDTTSATGTSRTNQRCVGVRLESFTKEKTGDERVGREYVACVKYKYTISAYNKEIARVRESGTSDTTIFNETAGDTDCAGAPLQITTTPSGAGIYINGEYRGDTPLKLKNVCRGNNTLKISHDNYETINEKLIVPTSTGKISKTLKRATKKVKISADYNNAVIVVNGTKQGRTPITYTAKLGETLEIKAIADGTETAVKHVHIDKYSDNSVQLTLNKKDVKLDFSSWLHRNSGWTVYVDGTKISSITKITPDQQHQLRFTKEGFRTVRDTYSHAPTDKVVHFDRDYTFVPVKSMSRTSGTEWSAFSGIGGYYMGTELDNNSKSTMGISLEALGIRLRADAFYGRLGLGYNLAGVSYSDIELKDGFYADINAGFNFGDRVSAFGLLGYGALDTKRPELPSGDYSGKTWHLYHGLGLEYNMEHLPFSVRLTYIIASVDLWDNHFVGSDNTKLHKFGLSFHVNWGGVARMVE